ncbi:MAG: translation elongation factor Ts [Elusimicrobia bacterium GWC2_65_9]|nr:MAG: translation elongation factor Ts [Elusimicrobia bacterium GWA2_66_18]OGR71036.1 MAG: translation elongation factor Ts [Elusimicrobia bacterium GWC2_65_9]
MPTVDSTQMIKDLREKTGAGMMDCKRALDEAKGVYDEALTILRKKGMADAAKKSARVTKEGAVAFKIDGPAGAIVEINCETDFVAKGEDFQAMAKTVCGKACAGALKSVEAANEEFVKPLVGKLGENMNLRRCDRFELKGPGLIAGYAHQPDPSAPAKKGALIEISAVSEAAAKSPECAELAKELLLQIVGFSPKYLNRDEVPAADIEKEKEIHAEILRKEGKPEASIPKIIEGKINKLFYQQWVLLDQVCVRDNKTPVREIIKATGAKLGGEVKVVRFVRYQLGE